MQQENWKAIESKHAVQLDDADRTLLDKVQTVLPSAMEIFCIFWF